MLYPQQELTPGAWRRAEDAIELPESARRLTLPIGEPAEPRFVPTRVLSMPQALLFLLDLGQREVRPSVRAWQLAAHVARNMNEGTMKPLGHPETAARLAQLERAVPQAACAVLVERVGVDENLHGLHASVEDDFARLDTRQALLGFLEAAQVALSAGLERVQTAPRRSTARELQALVVRLQLPASASDPWHLHVGVEGRAGARPAQELAAAAAQDFEPLSRWQQGQPLELSLEQASAFVRVAPAIEARGATVELPKELLRDVTEHMSATVHLRERSRSVSAVPTTPRLGLEDLVRYDLDVALGDTEVSPQQLRELAESARGIVQVRSGEWVALTEDARDRLQRIARALENRDAHMAHAHALTAALSGSVPIAGIEASVASIDDDMLRRTLELLRDPASFPDIEPGEGFQGELRPYQRRGLAWLAGMASLRLGACLADDMGLGKTVQVIGLLTHLRERSPEQRLRALVVCPTSLIGNWERELQRFGPELEVHVHHGPMRATRASQLAPHELILTSYGLVGRDREMLADIDFDIAIFDEAQAVKNPDTEQARATRHLRAEFRVALTGTPMENRLQELWAILDLLNPGILGTAGAFRRRFAAPIERSADEAAAARLRAITRPFMLRRVKHDPTIVPDLPDKQEHTVVCTLTPEQAALYQATVDGALAEVREREGIGRRGAVLALLTRLKQICNHPAQMLREDGPLSGRSGKLEVLETMLEELVAEGDRALVFTQYAQMGLLLHPHLKELLPCDVLFLHGGVPRAQRDELIARFQADTDEPLVFVLSLKAGGLGLNLMQAAHVFHYDRWWNPAVEDQATDRTHRIGQTRQIQVHKLVCGGTLEERIATIIDEKRTLAGRIIEVSGGESWIAELGDEELEELVALRTGRLEPTMHQAPAAPR